MTTAPGPGPASGTPGPASDTPAPRGGPPMWFAVLGIGGLLIGVAVLIAQVLGISVIRPGPQPTIPAAGQAADRTIGQVTAALESASFQVRDPVTEYRPGESPALLDVPRRLLQVILPSDPQGGYVVVYEFPTNSDAQRAGEDFAAYLSSGTGAIQYPRDTQFVVQRAGQTLVFFPWSAQANPDPRLPDLAAALETVGTPITP